MLTPLSHTPFNKVSYYLEYARDYITGIFFAVLSICNNKFEEYADYYHYKLLNRHYASTLFPENLIHYSTNQLYPGKRVEIEPPNTENSDCQLKPDPPKDKYLVGICLGMCVDHMNRVKASQKSFCETINEVGQKFSNGSTKKGFKYHHASSLIFSSNKYYQEKLKKLIQKAIIGKGESQENCSRELIESVYKDYVFKHEHAKNINFFAKNYKCKFLENDTSELNNLPDGDYFLRELPSNNSGHIVCIYKRKEGIAVFDPNYGTLFFKDFNGFNQYIDKSIPLLFKSVIPRLSLFHCKDRKTAC